MNSIDIYNAMMTQQKSRDQNSNIYYPRKCKFVLHCFVHAFKITHFEKVLAKIDLGRIESV